MLITNVSYIWRYNTPYFLPKNKTYCTTLSWFAEPEKLSGGQSRRMAAVLLFNTLTSPVTRQYNKVKRNWLHETSRTTNFQNISVRHLLNFLNSKKLVETTWSIIRSICQHFGKNVFELLPGVECEAHRHPCISSNFLCLMITMICRGMVVGNTKRSNLVLDHTNSRCNFLHISYYLLQFNQCEIEYDTTDWLHKTWFNS